MPRIKLSPELKEAISDLSHKEKDKLLFRLLPKDEKLVEQLTFQLLEGAKTMEERRETVKDYAEKYLNYAKGTYYSPGYLMMDLRTVSGQITRHVQTTKDKTGEIELNLYMLETTLDFLHSGIQLPTTKKSRTLCIYIVKRAIKVLGLVQKLHEDLQWDYREAIQEIGESIERIEVFKRFAAEEGLEIKPLRDFMK